MSNSNRILIVDDELSLRDLLSILFEAEGYQVDTAVDAMSAIEKIEKQNYDVVISDISMPGLSGLDLLKFIKRTAPNTSVLLITAYSDPNQSIEALKMGAYDYIAKPFKTDEIKLLVKNAIEKTVLKTENENLKIEKHSTQGYEGIIGISPLMKTMFLLMEKVSKTNSTVLITGESGTGKELIAKAIHNTSLRAKGPFMAINCGAIPENLIESELFGHTKGSFTGAISDKIGLFEYANDGTIFLDEIGELPLLMQSKLLRVIQEKEIRKVGSNVSKKIDVRIITATNKNLEQQVREGSFREDIYYRINVVPIIAPPLRERIEDIPLLIQYIIKKISGHDIPVSPRVIKTLMDYSFPGNVRELENILERCLIMSPDKITEDILPQTITESKSYFFGGFTGDISIPSTGLDIEGALIDLEKKYMMRAMVVTGGCKTRSSELLGMSFRTFRYKFSKYGLFFENSID